jgi:fructose-1,6-bisphosphatase/inositol monophosphatase family enzyme
MFACLDELIGRRGVHSVRMLGSACMALCYLAAGRLDALYTGFNGGVCYVVRWYTWFNSFVLYCSGDGWKPWDYAAGVCIVSEAGGSLVTATGGPFDVFSGSMVATSSSSLGSELVEALSGLVDMN